MEPRDLYPDHTASLHSLPTETEIFLHGLGEAWGIIFDVVEGNRTEAQGWKDLQMIRELYNVGPELDAAAEKELAGATV